ncbi:MAG: hypothetical protein JSW38_01625 [Dehalococcoidia bacterium]|nr:MAG: hypothetical protein JSW38_01625 [Dehalococcoidia bacterium]
MAEEYGTFEILDGAGISVKITLNGDDADIFAGGSGKNGDLMLFRQDTTDPRDYEQATIFLAGGKGDAILGGNGVDGDIVLRNRDGNNVISILAGKQNIVIRDASGNNVIELGKGGNLYLGGGGQDGDVVLRSGGGITRIHLDAGYGDMWIGGNGRDGDIVLFPRGATDINDPDQATIRLNGGPGDIVLSNADCAEDFDVLESEEIEPGAVMVIDEEGKLRPCKEPYDQKVAGIVSGGNGSKPGIILDKNPSQNARLPVALNGKVYCKVDAQYSPIEIGDLLTTSPTPGHAMKADEPLKAFGAVIGKALRPLHQGTGMIPVLVALQ